MRAVSIEELHLIRGVLAGSGHPQLGSADLSSMRVRAGAGGGRLSYAVEPKHDDSRFAATAIRTSLATSAGSPLVMAVSADQYGELFGIDVTDPSGGPALADGSWPRRLAVPENGPRGLDAVPRALSDTTPVDVRGRYGTLSIVGFVLSLIAVLNVVGLVLSAVALVQAKRSGSRRGFALAGVIVGAVGVIVTVAAVTVVATPIVNAVETCGRLGVGTHQVGNLTYTCTETSSGVFRRF